MAKKEPKENLWEINLACRASMHLRALCVKRGVAKADLLQIIKKHGAKLKPSTLEKIVHGDCHDINQLHLVALALNTSLSHIISRCELGARYDFADPSLLQMLSIMSKPIDLPPRKLSAKEKKIYDQAQKDLDKQLKILEAAEKTKGKLRKMKSGKKK